MMMSPSERPSESVSRMFGAPTEHVAEQMTSAGTPAPPRLPQVTPFHGSQYAGKLRLLFSKCPTYIKHRIIFGRKYSKSYRRHLTLGKPRKIMSIHYNVYNDSISIYKTGNPPFKNQGAVVFSAEDESTFITEEAYKDLEIDETWKKTFKETVKTIKTAKELLEYEFTEAAQNVKDAWQIFRARFWNFKRVHMPSIQLPIKEKLAAMKDVAVDKLGSFLESDLFKLATHLTIDDFYYAMSSLKPINLVNLLGQLSAARSANEAFAVTNCLLELYDCFWTHELVSLKAGLVMVISRVLSYFIKNCWSHDREAQWINQSVTVEENHWLYDILNFFDIQLEEGILNDICTLGLKIIAGIMALFVFIVGGKSMPLSKLSFELLIKKVRDFATSIKSFSVLTEQLPKVWAFVMSSVASLFGFNYEDDSNADLNNFKTELMTFKIEVTELVEIMNNRPSELAMDAQRIASCMSVMERLDRLYEKLIRAEVNLSATKPVFDDIRKNVAAIQAYTQSIRMNSCRKIEPFVLMLGGEAGIGKSQFVEWFAEAFAKKVRETYPDLSHMEGSCYGRNSTEKHWSAYVGQMFVVYDDFGQLKADTDHADIMLVKNPNRTQLIMADLSEKGRVFSSFGIIGATNQEVLTNSAVVKCTAALARRFEVNLLVSDPHYHEFKRLKGMSPGNYEKETGRKAMVPDANGEDSDIPYFDRNFEHLDFFRISANPAEHEGNDIYEKRLRPQEIVDLCFGYFQHYKNAYAASLIPRVDAAEAENAVDYNERRLHREYAAAKEDFSTSSVETEAMTSVLANKRKDEIKLAASGWIDDFDFVPPDGKVERPPKKTTVRPMTFRRKKQKAEETLDIGENIEDDLADFHQGLARQHRLVENAGRLIGPTQDFVAAIPLVESPEYPPLKGWENQAGEATSTANSFVAHEQRMGKIYLLVGPPGTGKTTVMRKVQTFLGDALQTVHAENLATFNIASPNVYIEDISTTAACFEQVRALVMQVYDNHSPIQNLFLTCNWEMASSYFENKEAKDAFVRRCNVFMFEYHIKKSHFFKKDEYFTANDVKHQTKGFSQMVYIIDREKSIADRLKDPNAKNAIITDDGLRMLLCEEAQSVDLSQFADVINVCVPYMSREMYTPDFVIKIKGIPIYEAFKVLYESPATMLRWLVSNKVEFIKGNKTKGLAIARAFQTDCTSKPEFPETLEQFIVMVNNTKFITQENFVTEVICDDDTVVVTPRKSNPRTVRMFKVTEQLAVANGIVSDAETRHQMNAATYNEYSTILETVSEVREQLPQQIEEVEERVANTGGFLTLFEKFPILKNVFKVSAFVLHIVTAGLSMSTLLQMHKDHFCGNDPIVEEKKKGKTKRKTALKAMCGNWSNYEYDKLKDAWDRYASTACKQRGFISCVRDYLDMCAYDDDDIDIGSWGQYLQHESREAKVQDQPQKVPLSEDLMIESREAKVQQDPVKQPLAEDLMIEGTDPVSIFGPSLPTVAKTERKSVFELPQLNTVGDESVKRNKSKKPTQDPTFTNESLLDPSILSMVNLVSRNTVEVGYLQRGVFTRAAYALMIEGRIGVTVYHIFQKEATMAIRYVENNKYLVHQIKPLRFGVSQDILIFAASEKCRQYSSIRGHLPNFDADFVKNYSHKKAVMVTSEFELTHTNRILRNIMTETRTTIQIQETQKSKEVFTYHGVTSGVKYRCEINTQQGDCGSTVLMNDTSIQHKILGIHNAANTQLGACTMIFQEYFDLTNESLSHQGVSYKSVAPIHHKIPYKEVAKESLLGMPIVAEIPEVMSKPTKSKFWNSPLALPGENPFQPSILFARDPRVKDGTDPYFKSIEKWNNPQQELDTDTLDEAVDIVARMYATAAKSKKLKTKVLTKTEAVNAGRQYDINPLNRTSSPGYPWNRYENKVGKFFANKGTGNEAYYGIDTSKEPGRKLQNSIDNLIDICRTPGHYPKVVFNGALKDEPVKQQKIDEVNTRSFAGAPLDYTIASRMYFGTLQGAIHQTRDTMPIQIGIDPTSHEWNDRINGLLSVSSLGVDLDFKGWDGTVPSAITSRIFRIYNAIAKATDEDWNIEHDLIRENLCRSVVKPYLLIAKQDGTFVVQAPGGMVSGSPRTADDNSLIHFVSIVYALLKIFRKNNLEQLCTIIGIRGCIKMMIYGDDGVYAIHPEILPIVNFHSIKEELSKIGFQCTAASKDGKDLLYQPVTSLEFLKRNTVRLGAFYFGALQPKTFFKMLGYCLGPNHHWYNEKGETPLKVDDLLQTARACLKESLFHGEIFYNRMSDHLESALDKVGITEYFPTYREMITHLGLPIPFDLPPQKI